MQMPSTSEHPRYTNRVERRKKRDAKIRQMFNSLHNVDRKRYDDVLAEVSEFWELSEETIKKIMRSRE